MKWRNVQPANVFMTRYPEFVGMHDDVWVVLEVGPSEDDSGFMRVRYAYLHELGNRDSISEFNVDPETCVDYVAMFDVIA